MDALLGEDASGTVPFYAEGAAEGYASLPDGDVSTELEQLNAEEGLYPEIDADSPDPWDFEKARARAAAHTTTKHHTPPRVRSPACTVPSEPESNGGSTLIFRSVPRWPTAARRRRSCARA